MENYEIEMDMEEDQQLDDFILSLGKCIRASQPEVQMLNSKRYFEVLFAKEALDDLLRQNGELSQSEIEFHPMFSSASLAVEVDCFEVRDFAAFNLAMVNADNFEFYPLTNGKVRLAFVFQHVMVAVA